METPITLTNFDGSKSPHSLGILIEWKRYEYITANNLKESPLAGDINWMETVKNLPGAKSKDCPHSLGTLIEWKRAKTEEYKSAALNSPHSLGTLIEWKQALSVWSS